MWGFTHRTHKGKDTRFVAAGCFIGPTYPSPLATIGKHIPATQGAERLRVREGLGNHCRCLSADDACIRRPSQNYHHSRRIDRITHGPRGHTLAAPILTQRGPLGTKWIPSRMDHSFVDSKPVISHDKVSLPHVSSITHGSWGPNVTKILFLVLSRGDTIYNEPL